MSDFMDDEIGAMGDAMNAEPWPFDVEALNKGDRIDVSRCEQIVGRGRLDPMYSLDLLKLAVKLAQSLRNLGNVWTVVQDQGGLKILTDEEASLYQRKRHLAGLAKATGAHEMMQHVDASQLSDAAKREHELALRAQGIRLLALQNAQKQVGQFLRAERRTLPGPFKELEEPKD